MGGAGAGDAPDAEPPPVDRLHRDPGTGQRAEHQSAGVAVDDRVLRLPLSPRRDGRPGPPQLPASAVG
ncbi:hypothetical protein B4Q13_22515, partial [Lacticaseibacillus rhamnosus]